MKLQLIAAALALLICQGSGPGATGSHRARLDCSSLGNRTSCHTFSQMLAAKDKDFDSLGTSGDDYVCFEKDDTFFHLFLMQDPFVTDTYLVVLSEYRSGILYDIRTAGLVERKRKGGPLSTVPERQDPFPQHGMVFSEGSSEINLSYGFQNVNHQKTDRSISIRLSILRFVDTFGSPSAHFEKAGQCVAYRGIQDERGTKPTVQSKPNKR